LIEYHKAVAQTPELQRRCDDLRERLHAVRAKITSEGTKEAKKRAKEAAGMDRKLAETRGELEANLKKIEAVEGDPVLETLARQHPDIGASVLEETAKLHEGDAENVDLWKRFLPYCQDEIDRIYSRLDVRFDHVLGESFYQPMLAGVVEELRGSGLATESEGAVCVFLEEFDAPMIVRKQDGAFLYATTDLATLRYRQQEFEPDEILYVVDSRQSEHFDKLFTVARRLGLGDIKLVHVKFGTVLGTDGRPMKTRSGSLIGLESLLDDAVERARQVVCDPERLAGLDPPMTPAEQHDIAEAVGIGAIKFADLSHHRTSDYRFNLDKMVALDGKTSTYVQYSYARTQGILRKAGISPGQLAEALDAEGIALEHPAERSLALMLLRFEEALDAVRCEYAPNQLADYLYETAKSYSLFNDNCPVLKADSDRSRATRLLLVTLCGRVLALGLSLLGIRAVDRM
jgi:arginyl-tRNA synthetase